MTNGRHILMSTKYTNEFDTDLSECRKSRAYALRVKLNRHRRLTESERNWLTQAVNKCQLFAKAITVGCWKFDFSDVMKSYKVKKAEGQWDVHYATDIPALMRCFGSKAKCVLDENV